jgi:hypothetical protein
MRLTPNIGRHRIHVSASGEQGASRLLESLRLYVAQYDFHACGGEGLSHPTTDTARCAGNHRDFIFEVFHFTHLAA